MTKFNKNKYETSQREKFMKNPGKQNRDNRKAYFNSMRGDRIPSSHTISDKRHSTEKKRMNNEARNYPA